MKRGCSADKLDTWNYRKDLLESDDVQFIRYSSERLIGGGGSRLSAGKERLLEADDSVKSPLASEHTQ